MSSSLRIREATTEDIQIVLEFIRDLAEYENHLDYFEATEERVRRWIFGPEARARVLLAHEGETPVGFAVYYFTFSTFAALPGIYLEDLFVKPSYRKQGVGKALLCALARVAKTTDCTRIEWAVLHWNENAIRFYKNLGAIPMNEWSVYRLTEGPLTVLATLHDDNSQTIAASPLRKTNLR